MSKETVRMLLVEDDPADTELALRALRRSGPTAHVDVVSDGAAALDHLFARVGPGEERVRAPRVVWLDLKLPKVDGLEVLRRIKGDARTREVVVVVLSSSREDRDVAEAYRHGANSYVVKPIDLDEFERVVSVLAQYWLSLNQAPP